MSWLSEAVTGVEDAVSGVLAELGVDPAVVEEAHTALAEVVELLDGDPFTYMATIQQDSFGTIPTATTLAYHHGRAHQVMDDTMKGIAKDLAHFAINIKKAAELLVETDQAAASDLNKKAAVASAFRYLDSHSSGERAHEQSRNDPRNPWPNDGRGGR